MLRNRFYYGVKPLLSSSIRLALRKSFTRRKRAQMGHVWPILPGSEKPPQGWPGWPEGKEFAVVLTHDVEGTAGLSKCRELMKREMHLGFRSSFNFIPEGSYAVTDELRQELSGNGFEVGIHDLHHDGKLYGSRRGFSKRAQRINHYLKEWGADGFRAGFMLHNLEWIHDLNILYDASTFDTDPFEPQPDGAGTIFPFWVPRPSAERSSAEGKVRSTEFRDEQATNRPGYVELPYTLCQDSTLFLLLGEPDPGIWCRKLDWIAKHGGMVLVNSHPDYMSMGESGGAEPWRFPVGLYETLLEYIRSRYGNRCWQVTARDLASWYKGTQVKNAPPAGEASRVSITSTTAPVRNPKRRICVVAYSNFESDNRVRRYAYELARRGDEVDVFSLKATPEQNALEFFNGVRVHRLLHRSRAQQKSRADFLLPIVRFFFEVSARVSWRHLRDPYDLFHIHNVPDFLVFSALFPRLSGAKVILDIHDILPEFYASKFSLGPNTFGVRLLKAMERSSARFAHHVILSNHLWRDTYTARTGQRDRCSCFINNVDTDVFRPRPRTRNDGKLIVLYPGGLQWHQGLDIAIRAFQNVSTEVPEAEFHIYGEGSVKADLVGLAHELGLDRKVRFFDALPTREIVEVMANADLGVVPKRADSFGNEAYSTKIMEFMSMGIPVVASSTKIDRYYFNDAVVRFFESGNSNALAQAMVEVLRDPDLSRRMVARALEYAALNSWATRKAEYLDLVDVLSDGEQSRVRTPSLPQEELVRVVPEPPAEAKERLSVK